MPVSIVQIDAFTDRPFAGNPAAVCLLDEMPEDAWMQAVAREMNLSETAFLVPAGDGFRLRWFTPAVEVDLCGHATLASAHFLWQEGHLEEDQEARFSTSSGLLTARRRGDEIEMDFPAEPAEPAPPPPELTRGLGAEPAFVGRNRLDYLVELADGQAVRRLAPDLGLWRRLTARGVIVTARAASLDYDFVSRYFAPAYGIDEDPVTGSAHCCLGPFWGERLAKAEMVGFQASARGGTVRVRLAGERVLLRGRAVTVLRAELV